MLSKPSALHTIRDIVVYAPDMYGTAYGAGAPPTAGTVLNDPYWSFADGATQGICAIVKVPNDRVVGTDIKFYLEFGVPASTRRTVVWRLDWLVRGLNNLYNVVPTSEYLPTVTNDTYYITATAKLTVLAYNVDFQVGRGQPVEFFLGIIRQGLHAADTETSAAHLHKLVMEYTAHY
jgi:hypothetical protein